MSEQDGKQTDRFVFRVNPSLHAAIAELADTANRSVNGEICTAVSKWLYERDALVIIKDRLLASASVETINMIRESVPSHLLAGDGESERCKTTVRFKDSVESDLRSAWEKHKLHVGPVSLNSFLKTVVHWWVTYSYQIAECAKAIHLDFQKGLRPCRPGYFATANYFGFQEAC